MSIDSPNESEKDPRDISAGSLSPPGGLGGVTGAAAAAVAVGPGAADRAADGSIDAGRLVQRTAKGEAM